MPQSAQSAQKGPECPKVPKSAQNAEKCTTVPKLPKIAKSAKKCRKVLKIAQSPKKFPKVPKVPKSAQNAQSVVKPKISINALYECRREKFGTFFWFHINALYPHNNSPNIPDPSHPLITV